jgi:hypothetical protein
MSSPTISASTIEAIRIALGSKKLSQNLLDHIVNNASWRRPVIAIDGVSTAFPVGPSLTIDGTVIENGDRVMFISLTEAAQNNKAYTVSGIGHTLFFTPEKDGPNGDGAPTDGDVLVCLTGTAYGSRMLSFNLDHWALFGGSVDANAIYKDGSKPFEASQSMGGFRLTSVGNGTAGADAVNKSQLDQKEGWLKYTVAHTALQTASATNDIELVNLPAGKILAGVIIKHSSSFSGGSIASYLLSVGVAEDLSRFASAFNVNQAVSDQIYQSSIVQFIPSFATSKSIRVSVTSTGANLSATTSGSVDIWIRLAQLP